MGSYPLQLTRCDKALLRMCHSVADVVISVVSSTGAETINVLEETPDEDVCVQLESLPEGGLQHDITLSLKPVAISACEFQLIIAPFNFKCIVST